MGKVTYKDRADFACTLIDNDIAQLNDYDKMDYLRIVLNYGDELGESILANNTKALDRPPIGEDRLENESSDIDLFSTLKQIFPELRVIDEVDFLASLITSDKDGTLNPLGFLRSSECLKGVDAREWLYARKYPHEYNHIHVFPEDLCILLPEYSDDMLDPGVKWIEPDGVREEGDPIDVLLKTFEEYKRRVSNGG